MRQAGVGDDAHSPMGSICRVCSAGEFVVLSPWRFDVHGDEVHEFLADAPINHFRIGAVRVELHGDPGSFKLGEELGQVCVDCRLATGDDNPSEAAAAF